MSFLKAYNIPIILLTLVLGIAYLSYYNYNSQKKLLLLQMEHNSQNIVSSVSTAIKRFDDIKSTVNLQKLMNDVSLGLEIFEFRYIEPDAIIKNSMFTEEIGKMHKSQSFIETMQGDKNLKEFFFETRDYVDVMAIYYPIYMDGKLIGIIDLSVDISEYGVIENAYDSFSVLRRQVDILNLLKSIEGSISNSLTISKKTDMHDFLHTYVDSTNSIIQISLIDTHKKIFISSDENATGQKLTTRELLPPSLVNIKGHLMYRTISDSQVQYSEAHTKTDMQLMLLLDASTYADHESQLLKTGLITTITALFFALFTSGTIYYSAMERSRKEKERLEHLVKERTKEIEELSKTDSLTGLWNRHFLEETLEMEFKRARRHNHDITLLLIDLDHFKYVNDTYGHMAGDEVLREISQRILGCLRETDFLGRYGGEELVVILPLTSLSKAAKVANIILNTVSEKPVIFESKSIQVTTSIGMSDLRNSHKNISDVFAEADKALYNAKELGRNRVEVFNALNV